MDTLVLAILVLGFLALGMVSARSDPNPEPEPETVKTASGLQYQDLKAGTGDAAWTPTLGPDAATFRMSDLLLFAFEGKKELLAPLG